MTDIWMAIAPRRTATRVIVTQGPDRTLLKANLRTNPRHHRAVHTLLEAIALWEGTKVHGALVADDDSTMCGTRLFHDAFGDESTPLYTLDVLWDRPKRRRRDGLTGLGDFRDLRRLIADEASR